MRRIWNVIVMGILWPLWLPLSALYLVATGANGELSKVPIGQRARTAKWLFQCWLGWTDKP